MKKYLPFLIIGLLVLAGAGVFLFFKLKPKQVAKTPAIKEKVNTVAVVDRPYVTLSPTSTGKHPAGTEVELTVHNTTLDAIEAEYELEYQAGSLLQGAFGSIDFSMERPPVSKTLLLGTCSAGGKCDYNQDVTGGTLLLRLSGGEEKFAVKGEWSYQLMGDREGKFSSRDSKFRLDVGAKGLPGATFVVVMQTMGLPKEAEGELISGPYYISAGANNKIKSAQLSWRLTEETENVTLLGLTGNSWKEYKSEVKDKTLTATVDQLTSFILIKPNKAD